MIIDANLIEGFKIGVAVGAVFGALFVAIIWRWVPTK